MYGIRNDVREALVTQFLALRKRLARKGSLVDRDVDGFCQTTVGGNDVTDLERDHITRNEVCRFDFGPSAVTLNFGFWSEGVHKGLDSITSVTFFIETDGGVNEQQKDDTNEVFPVRGLIVAVR